jgi:hypothetical protein
MTPLSRTPWITRIARLSRATLGPTLVAALALSGCAQMATYNAAYIGTPATPTAEKLAGKALVYTDKMDDDTPYVGAPTSFTGSATKLTIPLGVITREIAATVFGDLFQDGAAKANTLADAAAFRVVVHPRVSSFSYEYNQLKNLGFAVTPTVVLTLEVRTLDAAGKLLQRRTYDSGTVEMPAYLISGSPGEEIGKGAHKAVYDLMRRAAADVRADLARPGDPALAL